MEKILLAIDALNPEKNSRDFACYLSRLTKSKVTGVFLENFIAFNPFDHEQKKHLIEKNITLFKEACVAAEVCNTIHRDRGLPSKALVKESRYADIIVVAAGTSFNNKNESAVTEFIFDILKNTECAVIIAPENFNKIDEVVFTYDSSAASVFAIKQFTYLFPEFYNKKATILQVNKKGEWEDQHKHKLTEWLKDHYISLAFEAHKGESVNSLSDCILKKKNTFIVLGAYGRSALSQFFNASHADFLIKTNTQPIFIAHK